jgi:hypothetical protein
MSSSAFFDIDDAMDQPSSPISPTHSRHPSPYKRHRSPTDEDRDADDSDNVIDPALRNEGPTGPLVAATGPSAQNLTVFARRYATKRKLNPQHVTEVETFVAVRESVSETMPPSDT